ncbi:helix-turn-helix domain-containing protein [Nostoc sp. CENA67]|uniref:Helix-turn-helix domain-containing protein n=1 Tax=Amazonocrinis nigriterrae CENA67 TaxID=2794033 RepID=A0A8J7LBD7_9NOST|nr:helix-turn-helix domain-containing protein [Amazonocrinis nigriterrae CENA67]
MYWLKQENAPTRTAIAKAIGKHRNTVQAWLCKYRHGGLDEMVELKRTLLWSQGDSAMGTSSVGKAIRGARARI